MKQHTIQTPLIQYRLQGVPLKQQLKSHFIIIIFEIQTFQGKRALLNSEISVYSSPDMEF